jgi:hypothetical protein
MKLTKKVATDVMTEEVVMIEEMTDVVEINVEVVIENQELVAIEVLEKNKNY